MSDKTTDESGSDPDRIVRVDEAALLRDQLEFSRENAEDSDTPVEAAYQEARVKHTEDLLEQIEGDGLRESEVFEALDEADERLRELQDGEETPELGRVAAKHDAMKQVIREYFGGLPGDPVEIGSVVGSTEYKDGTLQIQGMNGTVRLQVDEESTTLATANLFLQTVGRDVTELDQPTPYL